MQPSPGKFVEFCDLGNKDLKALLRRARVLKRRREEGAERRSLEGKTLAMLFEKPSTRTRVSFEAGIAQLGGHAVALAGADSQMGRGEPAEDTAKVLASMCDAIVIRALKHELIERFARNSAVPVVNGLSDLGHPCQVLADLLTLVEDKGDLDGLRVLWAGDVNNVCQSWIEAANHLEFSLTVATPPALAERAGLSPSEFVAVAEEPLSCAKGMDAVVTDVWISMGEENAEEKIGLLEPYRVTRQLMAAAGERAAFMHCLPAVRGQEVEAEVIDGPQSVVWREAENRLHSQKALLELLICGSFPEDGE